MSTTNRADPPFLQTCTTSRAGRWFQALGALKASLRAALLAVAITPGAPLAGPVDPTLVFAATSGNWTSNARAGTYRVLVFSKGFEHVSSKVVAEWVADAVSDAARPAVVHGRELVGFGFFSLGAPVLTPLKNGVRVTLNGFDTHSPDRKLSCVFDLHPSGRATVVKPCE